ncbi:hypothetical protein HOD75_01770 [archaeon]|jgi:hypothetical protein|nr:hypothetical protein [archaeon]MBT4241605.1 hypothetical protein [archaeon]MBT4418000.1 hypothetical protein [archaeon]
MNDKIDLVEEQRERIRIATYNLNRADLLDMFPNSPQIAITCSDFMVNPSSGCSNRSETRGLHKECLSQKEPSEKCPYADYFEKLPKGKRRLEKDFK